MYVPYGPPTLLRLSPIDNVQPRGLHASRDRSIMLVVGDATLHVLYVASSVELCALHRCEASLAKHGAFLSSCVAWKSTSDSVAVATDKGYLLFYQLVADANEQTFALQDVARTAFKRTSDELFAERYLPRVSIHQTITVQLPCATTRLLVLRDELVVFARNGIIYRLDWSGQTIEEFNSVVCKLPLFIDQQQGRALFAADNSYISDAIYSPLVGGFACVLSDGRVTLLTSPNGRYAPNETRGILVPGVSNATCVSVSHKHRLVLVGCTDGSVLAHSLDEVTGALQLVGGADFAPYIVPLTTNGSSPYGSVSTIRCTPCGNFYIVVWEKSGYALCSVFGSVIWCSGAEREWKVTSCDWSADAHNLWLLQPELCRGVVTQAFYHSAGLNNPAARSCDRVVLVGAKEVCLSPSVSIDANDPTSSCYWEHFLVPASYISTNAPLRYACVSDQLGSLAVAGTRGVALCNLHTKKWRLFGNETQERDMMVVGGLAWWHSFVIAPCFNFLSQQNEVRWYSRDCSLDNSYMSSYRVESQTVLMNIFDSTLILFDMSGCIELLAMKVLPARARQSKPVVSVTKLAEVRVSEITPHPVCVVNLELLSLAHDPNAPQFTEGADTLLLNISGRVIMLHPATSPDSPAPHSPSGHHLNQPMLVASCIEDSWYMLKPNTTRPHLTQALWLHCGQKGIKIWMPLFPKDLSSSHTFISKRIMLPLDLSFKPLILLNDRCVAVGVEVEGFLTSVESSADDDKKHYIPNFTLSRRTDIYLHHILRQLLSRNLGMYALQIAATCRDLPFFSFSLEMLLHRVLEEEATSSEPIPDPLLPRVIAFIQEFPEFYQTVAHCARKSEIALWKHLFHNMDSPNELFEVCIREGHYEVAASFLIVLQNMEPGYSSQESSLHLLQACLDNRQWAVAKEVVRFVSSIHPDDLDTPPPRTSLHHKQSILGPRFSITSPIPVDEECDSFFPLLPGQSGRLRHSSTDAPLGEKKGQRGKAKQQPAPDSKEKAGKRRQRSSTGSTEKNSSGGPNAIVAMSHMLRRFARYLLSNGRLYDLGCFSANLEFHLVLWLTKERNTSAIVGDYVQALRGLHTDFSWPYPMCRSSSFYKIPSPSPSVDRLSSVASVTKPLNILTQQQESIDSGYPNNISPRSAEEHGPKYEAHVQSVAQTKHLLVQQQNRRSVPYVEEEAKCARKESSQNEAPSVVTEDESVFGRQFDDNGAYDPLDWDALDVLANEVVGRGPRSSEVQLRYWQQVVHEASCCDWSLLVSLVLCDMVGLARSLNRASLATASPDTLPRLLRGVTQLQDWAMSECQGYVPMLTVLKKHLCAIAAPVFANATARPGVVRRSPERTNEVVEVVKEVAAVAPDSEQVSNKHTTVVRSASDDLFHIRSDGLRKPNDVCQDDPSRPNLEIVHFSPSLDQLSVDLIAPSSPTPRGECVIS